jgi:hypothetical protein
MITLVLAVLVPNEICRLGQQIVPVRCLAWVDNWWICSVTKKSHMRRIEACEGGISIQLQIVKVGQLSHYLHKGIVGRFAAFTVGDHEGLGCDTESEYTIKHQHNVSA